jgi:succinyl-CoA synthetase beta subunit
MNLHEYQSKELFAQYQIPVAAGTAIKSLDEVANAVAKIAEAPYVVKSQIHAGGRGKGTFTDGFKGGVKLAKTADEAKELSQKMLGNTLVTKQTGPEGRKVQTLYITAGVDIEKEFYAAITLNRATSAPVLIVSSEGGVEIEEVAHKNPKAIVRVEADPVLGLRPFQARLAAAELGLKGDLAKQAADFFLKLYKLWYEKDLAMIEVNPLVVTKGGKLVALDAKVSVEDNALYRHPELAALRDLNEEDPKETEATENGLNYVALDGNIACMVNGAGLAMSTMDIISYYGGKPANFLDVGGGANEKQVETAFRIILKDKNVKAIFVNIFGGIMKCDTIATGIINAARNIDLKLPLVVRLEGTNFELGRKLLAESGLKLVAANSFTEAAQKVVELAKTS